MFAIEKDVPVPERRQRKYPFAQMAVGDSFVAPLTKRGSVDKMASAWGKAHGAKFTTRKVDDNLRVWRTA